MRFDVGGGRDHRDGHGGRGAQYCARPWMRCRCRSPTPSRRTSALAARSTARAQITGTALRPTPVRAHRAGINAAAIRDFGITPLSFNATGSYAGNGIRLAALSAQGTGGLRFAGNGTVPLTAAASTSASRLGAAGARQSVRRRSRRAAQRQRRPSTRGHRQHSRAAVSAAASRLADAGYIDPELNLRLVGITGIASLDGDRLVIDSLSAPLSTGGSVAVGGSDRPRRRHTRPISPSGSTRRATPMATCSSRPCRAIWRLSGPIAASPTALRRRPGREGRHHRARDIRRRRGAHRRPAHRSAARRGRDARPRDRRCGRRADPAERGATCCSSTSMSTRRTRSSSAAVGSMSKSAARCGSPGRSTTSSRSAASRSIAGGSAILGQRVDLHRGRGDAGRRSRPVSRPRRAHRGRRWHHRIRHRLGPRLGDRCRVHLAARRCRRTRCWRACCSSARWANCLRCRSPGSPAPRPSLPAAARQLAGRLAARPAGLADLDIVTDDNGNVAVQAGRYIQDNIYLGVQAGADGNTRVTVNLDITDDVKARASTGIDGEFERRRVLRGRLRSTRSPPSRGR